jgi:hypothetical protein
MERVIEIRYDNWIKYSDSVGDKNPIHRNDEDAKRYGLERVVAPGMFIASHIQKPDYIGAIKGIKFPGVVYDGDKLIINEREGKNGVDYVFRRGDDVVCKVNGVREESGTVLDSLKDRVYTYEREFWGKDLDKYLESVGCSLDLVTPEMFMASLSASALLSYGEKIHLVGMHASQSFNVCDDYNFGEIFIGVGNERRKGPMITCDLLWEQKDKVIASGKALVMAFEDENS